MLRIRSSFRSGRCWLFALPLVLALGAMPAVAAAANTKVAAKFVVPKVEVVSWQLPNGLKVLFLPNHKAPIATVQVFYHVGSKDEHVGIRGVAHMFEHMMFKGTEHVAPEEHARLLKEVGGQVNAFTTEDLTAYHDTVPPSYLGFAMQLEAERMRSLKLFPAIIDSERKVVEEEKRLRIDNNPIGKAIERFRALAYTKHPYNWTAIGTIEDLDKVTPEDCQKFYDTYYQPNNATLIVVGDVQEAEVRSLADKYFGPIPRGAEPPRNYVEEPPQTAMRSREHGDRGAGAGGGRRLSHPARGRSRHRAARGAGRDPVGRRIVAHAPAAGAQGSPGDRRRRRHREHGVPRALHRVRGAPARSRPEQGEGRAARRGPARAHRAGDRARAGARRRTSWPPATSSGCRPSTASRSSWGSTSTCTATGASS